MNWLYKKEHPLLESHSWIDTDGIILGDEEDDKDYHDYKCDKCGLLAVEGNDGKYAIHTKDNCDYFNISCANIILMKVLI